MEQTCKNCIYNVYSDELDCYMCDCSESEWYWDLTDSEMTCGLWEGDEDVCKAD
jgi:hypothetical protein